MRIHLVYARGARKTSPQAITRELARRLEREFAVSIYDVAAAGRIVPERGDVLIGHPHGDPRTVFARSFFEPGWAKRIVMCPYSHGMPELCAWVEPYVKEADWFLAITGKYWFERMGETLFSHWKYKTRRLDMAVAREDFPTLRRRRNPKGKRRFLYIGYPGAAKGTDYLCRLAEENPELGFGWVGGGGVLGSERVEALGMCDFHLEEGRRIAAGFDFLITCGRSDANPATILEAVSWGLVPVGTPESGYQGEEWLVNIPLDDVARASGILRRLNDAEPAELDAYVARGNKALDRRFTWDRFAAEVMAALREPGPAEPSTPEWIRQAQENRARLCAITGQGAEGGTR